MGLTLNSNQVYVDDAFNPVTGRTIEQILYRYIKQHQDVLSFDKEEWLKCYAMMRISNLSHSWAYHNSKANNVLVGCVADFSAGPDDLLNFQYMQVSFKIRVQEMLKLILKHRGWFYDHIRKRYKDKRYKYFHRKEYKSVNYWLKPEHWVGFQGGFVLDFLMCVCIPSMAKRHCFGFPIQPSIELGFYNAVKLDPALIELFNNDSKFLGFLSRLFLSIKPRPMYWTIGRAPLNENVEQYITYMLIEKRKEMAEHGQSEATEGQQGEVLQEASGAVLDTAPASAAGGTPVAGPRELDNGNDNNIVGFAGVDTGGLEVNPGAEEVTLTAPDHPTILGTSRATADMLQPQPLTAERLMQALEEIRTQLDELAANNGANTEPRP